jgi:hypothetical protein
LAKVSSAILLTVVAPVWPGLTWVTLLGEKETLP